MMMVGLNVQKEQLGVGTGKLWLSLPGVGQG